MTTNTIRIGDKELTQDEVVLLRSMMLATGMEGMRLDLALKFYRKAEQWYLSTQTGAHATIDAKEAAHD